MIISNLHKHLNGKKVYWEYRRCYGRLAIREEIQEISADNEHIFICQDQELGHEISSEYRFGYKYSFVYQIDPEWSVEQILARLKCRLVRKEKFEI
jgi:hypothetical protein